MQNLLMGLIVVAAAGYAAWYWLPASLRQRLGRVHASLAQAPTCHTADCGSGCGGCAKAPDATPVTGEAVRCVIPIVAERVTPRAPSSAR